jgi:hypothetical protein
MMEAQYPFSAIGKVNYRPCQPENGSIPVIARSSAPYEGQRFSLDVRRYAEGLANSTHCSHVFRMVRPDSNVSSYWDPYDVHVLGKDFLRAVLLQISELNLRWYCISWSKHNETKLLALCGAPGKPPPDPMNTFTVEDRAYWGDRFLTDAINFMRRGLYDLAMKQMAGKGESYESDMKSTKDTGHVTNPLDSKLINKPDSGKSSISPTLEQGPSGKSLGS